MGDRAKRMVLRGFALRASLRAQYSRLSGKMPEPYDAGWLLLAMPRKVPATWSTAAVSRTGIVFEQKLTRRRLMVDASLADSQTLWIQVTLLAAQPLGGAIPPGYIRDTVGLLDLMRIRETFFDANCSFFLDVLPASSQEDGLTKLTMRCLWGGTGARENGRENRAAA